MMTGPHAHATLSQNRGHVVGMNTLQLKRQNPSAIQWAKQSHSGKRRKLRARGIHELAIVSSDFAPSHPAQKF